MTMVYDGASGGCGGSCGGGGDSGGSVGGAAVVVMAWASGAWFRNIVWHFIHVVSFFKGIVASYASTERIFTG